MRTVALLIVVAALALATYGPAVDAMGPVEQLLAPWQGFSTYVGDASGIVENPASLIALEEYSVRLQTVRPLTAAQPNGMIYAYREPDLAGVGAGQIAYVSMTEDNGFVSQFVYAGAKRAGRASAVGLGLTYTKVRPGPASVDAFTTWGLDFGFHSVLFERFALGAVVQNAYLLGHEAAADIMLPTLATGVALDLGAILLAGDYLLRGREAPFEKGYKYGVEGRLGRLSARFGQRSVPEYEALFTYSGLGYRFDRGSIDLTLGERASGRSLSLGLSLYF